MTNVLDNAADILESGWCRGGMVLKDGSTLKFCSVGAVAAADLGYTLNSLDASDWEQRQRIDIYAWGDDEDAEGRLIFGLDRNHPALVALKEELVETGEIRDYPGEEPWNAVMDWNDGQDNSEAVVKRFRSAARRLDDE